MNEKEAIENLKELYNSLSTDRMKESLITLIPELKENKDDKTRKQIIRLIRGECSGLGLAAQDRCLQWIENHKYHQPLEEILTKSGIKAYKENNLWYVFIGDNAESGISGVDEKIENAIYLFLTNLMKRFQPARWTKEDEKYLKWLCMIIRTKRLEKVITLQEETKIARWMDKWLNYDPTSRHEAQIFTKEDRGMLDCIIAILCEDGKYEQNKRQIDFLNRLKNKIK